MACVLVVVMFMLYSNRMNNDDEEGNGGIISPDESPLKEGQSSEVATTKIEVEVEIPSTPQIIMSDMSDASEVSSLSESPFTVAKRSSHCYNDLEHASSTPSTQGLVGIAKPNRYRYVGDCTLGFAAEQQQPQYWGIYKDSSMMESP